MRASLTELKGLVLSYNVIGQSLELPEMVVVEVQPLEGVICQIHTIFKGLPGLPARLIAIAIEGRCCVTS